MYRPGRLNDTRNFKPIPDLVPESGDVHLVFMVLNRIRFGSVVHDPLFAANNAEQVFEKPLNRNKTVYFSSLPAKAVGCIVQVSRGSLCASFAIH
jgi:hypothetical protein